MAVRRQVDESKNNRLIECFSVFKSPQGGWPQVAKAHVRFPSFCQGFCVLSKALLNSCTRPHYLADLCCMLVF